MVSHKGMPDLVLTAGGAVVLEKKSAFNSFLYFSQNYTETVDCCEMERMQTHPKLYILSIVIPTVQISCLILFLYL